MDGVEGEGQVPHGSPLLALPENRLEEPELSVAGGGSGHIALAARPVALDLEEGEARAPAESALVVQDEVPELG